MMLLQLHSVVRHVLASLCNVPALLVAVAWHEELPQPWAVGLEENLPNTKQRLKRNGPFMNRKEAAMAFLI